MANGYFIKLYMDILDDPKIYQLRDALRWRFVECLLVAGELRDSGHLPPTNKMAWRLRCDQEKLETDLSELGEAGLLDLTDGCWHVTKFSKRQARQYSDNSDAIRQREYRERKRKEAKEKEREEKITDVDIDTDMSHVTRHSDMSQRNVTNNNIDPFLKPAIGQLVDDWLELVGASKPADTELSRSKLFDPAKQLLNHLNGDFSLAFELVKKKRAEMLTEGKTPKWLEAVVFRIVADNDMPQEKAWYETN